ncbi:MAG TPA: sugar transferase [Candidatus Polarisedimenticolaceae bacterium]
MTRVLSVGIAIVAVIVASPLAALIAICIKLEDAGPVFFRQDRAGQGGRNFRLLKFRTMVTDAERKGLGVNVAPNDDRITRVGRVLRRWSLDELPQFLNVLKGDMNVVGPRPALPFQAARYTPSERRRLEVRPGLTGWAQVHGRNALSWKQRIELDVWYVDHRNLAVDLLVLLRTPAAMLRSEGLYEPGAGLDDEFNAPEGEPPVGGAGP